MTYASRLSWLRSFCGLVLRRRVVFGVNSGEFVGHRQDKLRSTWQIWLARAVTLTGGSVVVAGVSIRPGTSVGATYLPQLAKHASIVSWRDGATLSEVGLGSVQPDWAFRFGGNTQEAERGYLAVSLRGDRPAVSDAWIDCIKAFARSEDLLLRVVVQVRRDSAAAISLSRRLEAELLDWPAERPHGEHERVVREFYRSCRVIVSDRIHALIIALTEGVIPVGVVTQDVEKVRRTFEHVAPLGMVDATRENVTEKELLEAVRVSSAIQRRLPAIREELDKVQSRISAC
ncbi:hypothetical protein QSU92_12345 [Microbacterium sp. ET2]|uniref:hypothetical protein n=1 Tax=Microbacterium albipurpureum TaxID=3050384 RepID=UPI00259CA4A0|nr:hypothetical protein [Microbacterium sp. ET2 (Ac-2212)]WJL94753.1 hypothetical protein QSU92_12345 [Microbacterium sp. ET2 (Ac-2212)]